MYRHQVKIAPLLCLILVGCSSQPTNHTIIDTIDSLHQVDQLELLDGFGKPGILIEREVKDSMIINSYEVDSFYVIFEHNLDSDQLKEFIYTD